MRRHKVACILYCLAYFAQGKANNGDLWSFPSGEQLSTVCFTTTLFHTLGTSTLASAISFTTHYIDWKESLIEAGHL